MFGEKEIIGHCCYKMDYKNRIAIPSFTHGESDDEIYAKTYKSQKGYYILKLMSPETYKEDKDRLKKIIDNPNTSYDDLKKLLKN